MLIQSTSGLTDAMLEKSKDESESVEKFRSILMAAVIGALLLFAAPEVVNMLTGVDLEGYVKEGSLFGIPGQPRVPEVFTGKVFDVLQIVLWVARVVIVLFIVMAVIMLRIEEPAPASGRQRPGKAY